MENIRKLSYDEVEQIVRDSNPQEINGKGTGFWLFAQDIQKAPDAYLNENSPWKPVYYGLFDSNNDKCIGMVCISYTYEDTYKNYPYVLIIQSIEKGCGIKLFQFIYKLLQSEGYDGVACMALTDDLLQKYQRIGFKIYNEKYHQLQKTFRNNIQDSVVESSSESGIKKKVITQTEDKIEIDYEFGGYNKGLSNELYIIGNDIESLSKDYYITLSNPYFDEMENYYSFTVKGFLKENMKLRESAIESDNANMAEDILVQLYNNIVDANKTNNPEIILDVLKKSYEILNSGLFQFLPYNCFSTIDDKSIGNLFIQEIKKSFEIIDSEDGLYLENERFKKEFNELIYSTLPNQDTRDFFGDMPLYENYLSGSYGDPTFSTFEPKKSYDSGYMYSIKSLSHSMEGNKQPATKNYSLIHVGSYVSGRNKDGELVYGRIYRIIKDEDGFIKKVYIFNKNAKLINIDIDSIISVPNGTEKGNNYLLDSESINTKLPIAESVKHNGPLSVNIKGKEYYLTLNEGQVVICNVKNNEIYSMKNLYEIDNSLAKQILNKI